MESLPSVWSWLADRFIVTVGDGCLKGVPRWFHGIQAGTVLPATVHFDSILRSCMDRNDCGRCLLIIKVIELEGMYKSFI